MDAEYYAMGDASKEGIHLNTTLSELHEPMPTSLSKEPVPIQVDNTSAIKLANNPVFHKRSKHIEIRHHFIRQLVEDNLITFVFVGTAENIADMFTKPLKPQVLKDFRKILFGPFQGLLD